MSPRAYADRLDGLLIDLQGELDDFARWAETLASNPLARPLPGCDLAGDEHLLGAFGPYEILSGFYVSAANHMHAFHDSLRKSGTVYFAASVTILRGALEPAALALWIVGPDDQAVRAKRALRVHFGNLVQYRKYQNAIGVLEDISKTSAIDRRIQDARDLAAQSWWPGGGLGEANTTEILRDLGGDTERLWRLSSGVAHGMDWTKLNATTITDRRDSGGRTPDLLLHPDPDLIAELVKTVHRIYAAALIAYGTRATPPVR
jgi:hypothetical protein